MLYMAGLRRLIALMDAVASGARSNRTSCPPLLAALPFQVAPLQSVTLPVWISQSTMASSPISLTPSDSATCLSPGLDPCLCKLVEKLHSGIYVEMKELLGGNISLLNELESLNVVTTLSALPSTAKPRHSDHLLYCFLAYTAL